MNRSRSTTLLASTLCWPGPAKLAIALSRQSCRLEAVCPPDHPFSFMESISRLHPYRFLNSLQSLLNAIQISQPSVIIPCDDGAVWQLHALHGSRPELRALIERSVGSPSSFTVAASRAGFMEIARELEIRHPETRHARTLAELNEAFAALGGRGLLKLDKTTGGKGVRAVHSLEEARLAWKAFHRPQSFFAACGRRLLMKDAAALWNRQHLGAQRMILQQCIDGRPANTMFACRDGELLGLTTVEVLSAENVTGAALAVRIIENDEIRRAAEHVARRLRLSGFHGLDFMLEHGTGRAWLIELNPRCTQLGHLETPTGGDLAGIFARGFHGTHAGFVREPSTHGTVVFFPQALTLGRYADYLNAAYVDVPWEEPRLVRELMRRDWRERTLLGRMYYPRRSRKRNPAFFSESPQTNQTSAQNPLFL